MWRMYREVYPPRFYMIAKLYLSLYPLAELI